MKMSTFGPVAPSREELVPAARKALEDLGCEARLVILFTPASADQEMLISSVRSVSGVPLVGATSGGGAFTERGMTRDGVVGAFMGGESASVSCLAVRNVSKGIRSAVSRAFASLAPADLPGHSVFVLAGALSCDGEALATEIRQSVPSNWPIFGGLAGDNWNFTGTRVFLDDSVFDDGAVIVYINDLKPPSVRERHGFSPAEGSRELKVTGSEGNLVTAFDGRPAVEAYRAELGRLGFLREDDSFIRVAARYSLGIRSLWGERLNIRTPMAASPSGVSFAGTVPAGSSVRVVCSSPERMIEASSLMMTDTIGSLGGERPSAVIVIDCAARRELLGDRYREEVAAMISLSRSPVIGFTSYGEIARFPGSMGCFHNMTSVAAVW